MTLNNNSNKTNENTGRKIIPTCSEGLMAPGDREVFLRGGDCGGFTPFSGRTQQVPLRHRTPSTPSSPSALRAHTHKHTHTRAHILSMHRYTYKHRYTYQTHTTCCHRHPFNRRLVMTLGADPRGWVPSWSFLKPTPLWGCHTCTSSSSTSAPDMWMPGRPERRLLLPTKSSHRLGLALTGNHHWALKAGCQPGVWAVKPWFPLSCHRRAWALGTGC